MNATPEAEPKRIERVVLACVQCRSRHVKCDATLPICNRCGRDGKECNYQKSRRGGLDKAALARRRLRLQQESGSSQQETVQTQVQIAQHPTLEYAYQPSTGSSPIQSQPVFESPVEIPVIDAIHIPEAQFSDQSPAFKVSIDRLLELYFENFSPAFPIVLPFHYLQQRRLNENHGLNELVLVLKYIGSIYAPWTPSEPYLKEASQSLDSPTLAHTPFNIQALMLFAIAQYHSNFKNEGRARLNLAITIAIELRMNQKGFAQAYGESDPVLEESWRRTYYMLHVADQHFAIVSNSPMYTLANVPNNVDLPCDDEYYESGHIPPVVTWQDYENREFAEIEIIYSSIVYLYDMVRVVASVMEMFIKTGIFGEAMIESCDTKVAIWTSLLPANKRDPLRRDGRIDEVMFTAHMIGAITISSMHRPFSSLSLSPEEMITQAFVSPTPFVVPPKEGRGAHTARTLRAIDMQTKLLAIPCTIERHNVFTMCICAQMAAAQISACANLLEDRALSIARDRVRLSIGFLNAMGSFWSLGRLMAKEVRHIARRQLSNDQSTVVTESEPTAEIDFPRDELIWPVNPSAQIDIYSGLMLPVDWNSIGFTYSSSSSSTLN